MFKNLRISTRLFLLTGFLSALLITIGIIGLRGISTTNESLGTVYADSVTPIRHLKVVSDM